MKKTVLFICLILLALNVFAALGCGEKRADKGLGDCVGYDWMNVPRYPGSRRVEYTMDISLGLMLPERKNTITYETKASVQDIADFYIEELPPESGWEIKDNTQRSFRIYNADGAIVDVGEKNEMYDSGEQGNDWNVIDITCEEEPFTKLKATDPTVDAEEYQKPDSKITAYVKEQREVAGEDINETRPPGKNTVRVEYNKGSGDRESVEYLTDEPFNKVVSAYTSEGFMIMASYVKEQQITGYDNKSGFKYQSEAELYPANGEKPSIHISFFSDRDGGATKVNVSTYPL